MADGFAVIRAPGDKTSNPGRPDGEDRRNRKSRRSRRPTEEPLVTGLEREKPRRGERSPAAGLERHRHGRQLAARPLAGPVAHSCRLRGPAAKAGAGFPRAVFVEMVPSRTGPLGGSLSRQGNRRGGRRSQHFKLIVDKIPGAKSRMARQSIAVVGFIGPNGDRGFAVLANSDGGHAEELLDHDCSPGELTGEASVSK